MTGIGAMMAGGNPSGARQENDFYPTPSEVTMALMNACPPTFNDVHECAAGDLAITKVLQEMAYDVVSSDIVVRSEGVIQEDFLQLKERRARCLVTNPPFNLAKSFIKHAHDLKYDYIALVLKATYWHAKNRYDLFVNHRPYAIFPLTWRPDFLDKGRPTMEICWSVWKRGHDGFTVYEPLLRPERMFT